MESSSGTFLPFTSRPEEYDRLLAFLLDQRFFFPIAISTSLPGGQGFGKTSLARALCGDPRVREAFNEGIFWVRLGAGLTPLELLSRVEQLIYDISGQPVALENLAEAEARLRDVLQPRRSLLVIDEVSDGETLDTFLQNGPGGACLLITHDDAVLPLSARRVSVDIMVPREAAALLASGLDAAPASSAAPDSAHGIAGSETQGAAGESAPPDGAGTLARTLADLPAGSGGKTLLDAAKLAEIERSVSGASGPAALSNLPPQAAPLLEALADRLNEWPLLLALCNGCLRGYLAAASGTDRAAAVTGALRALAAALDRQALTPGWRIDDPAARQRALSAVLAACMDPLDPTERQRYLELPVFPAGETVPVAALSVLWDLDEPSALRTCRRLASAALLELAEEADRPPAIRLHAMLHACLLDQLWVGQLAALHNRLVEGYRARCFSARCPAGWASGPNDGYFFSHLARHLIAASRRDELQALLFDFDWIANYLASSTSAAGILGAQAQEPCGDKGQPADLYALLGDYDLALSTSLDRQSGQLRLVQEALRMAAPVLARDPRQLASQMLGRLLPFNEPEVRGLVEKAAAWRGGPWLRPLAACFTPPGSDEVRVLAGHTDWVTGVGLLPDGQHAVSSSLDGTLRVWDLSTGQVTRIIAMSPGLDEEGPAGGPNGLPNGAGRAGDGMPHGTGPLSSRGGRIVTGSLAGKLPGSRAGGAQGGGGQSSAQNGGLAGSDPLGQPVEMKPGGVSALVLTPDGQKAITAGWDGVLRVWNLSTGHEERIIQAHVEAIGALAITPDGRRVITGSDDRLIRVWDLASGEQQLELIGHADVIRALTVTADGRSVLSASWDASARLWDLDSGRVLQIFTGHEGWVQAVAFTPDGYKAISSSWDRTMRVWDLWTGENISTISDLPAPVFALAVMDNNRVLIAGSSDGSLTLWDLESGQLLRRLGGHMGGISALSLTRSGRFAVTVSDDRTLRVWDLVAMQGEELRPGHAAPVPALLSVPAAQPERTGTVLISASWDGTLKVWDPANGREVYTLRGHTAGVTSLVASADGRLALSGSRDGTLKLWDLVSGQELRALTGHGATVTAAALTPDGLTAASGDETGVLKVWDVASGSCLADFHGVDAIWACALTPDGKTLTASAASGKMYFLQVER